MDPTKKPRVATFKNWLSCGSKKEQTQKKLGNWLTQTSTFHMTPRNRVE